MTFENEHLLPGQVGHFFVLLAFVASIVSTISYFTASKAESRIKKIHGLTLLVVHFSEVFSLLVVFGSHLLYLLPTLF